MAMFHVNKAGDIAPGGLNFYAKVRRQSFDPEDLTHTLISCGDLCARAFLQAAQLIEAGKYDRSVADRYAGWDSPEPQAMLNGMLMPEQIATMSGGLDHRSAATLWQPGANWKLHL